MKSIPYIIFALSLGLFLQSAAGAKPEGMDKPMMEKKEMMKEHPKGDEAATDAGKERVAKAEKAAKDEAEKKAEKAEEVAEAAESEAKEKSNSSDKTDAVRKEAGKGSETGQAKRAEHSRKWWKFWGD